MPYKDNTITHHVRYARSTMVHEAGHAIAAWMCEREVELMAVAGMNMFVLLSRLKARRYASSDSCVRCVADVT